MVQLFLQEVTRYRFNLQLITGNRDTPPPMSRIAARLDRARNNMMEALPFFLGLSMLDLVLLDNSAAATNGALIFLLARMAYVPAYVSGIPWIRSLIWLVANAGLLAMAWPLI